MLGRPFTVSKQIAFRKAFYDKGSGSSTNVTNVNDFTSLTYSRFPRFSNKSDGILAGKGRATGRKQMKVYRHTE